MVRSRNFEFKYFEFVFVAKSSLKIKGKRLLKYESDTKEKPKTTRPCAIVIRKLLKLTWTSSTAWRRLTFSKKRPSEFFTGFFGFMLKNS